MHLDWVKPIWQAGEHNAFTDLCLYRERLFLAFREAATHVSGDGRIRVLELTEQGHIRHRSFIQIEGVDLRDPKLSVTPDGKLLLIAYARHNDQDNNTVVSKPICWFSSDGKSWSSHHYFGDQFWWLWRVTWTGNECLGLAYNRSQQAINLYKGDPRRTFHTHKAAVFSKEKNGKGYPNESDIQILSDGTAVALLRRDQDTCTAQLGMSKKPYTQWQWDDLKDYVGGPAFCLLNDSQAIVAGRMWLGNQPKTGLWTLDLENRQLKRKLLLPSAGDSSYPGLVLSEDKLLVSYYSSHKDGKSNIYLAQISVNG